MVVAAILTIAVNLLCAKHMAPRHDACSHDA